MNDKLIRLAAGLFCMVLFAGCLTGQPDKIEVAVEPGAYTDFSGQRVAILVSAPTTMHYHGVLDDLAQSVAVQLKLGYDDIDLISHEAIDTFQRLQPHWIATPPSRLVRELDVDRLILIDVSEFRPHQEGNPYVLKGIASIRLRVVERQEDLLAEERYQYACDLNASYPDSSVGAPSGARLTAGAVTNGLVQRLSMRIGYVLRPVDGGE